MRNILFLCTGNSARSIMAEAYMNHAGAGRWRAFSAGSNPTGKINPFALETLAAQKITPNNSGARSKSWNEFAVAGAPVMDAVVTVCDNAAGEVCPLWPSRSGRPQRKLHWSFPDPASIDGDDATKRAAFETVFAGIRAAIDGFLSQPHT
jgi:arsenate reductase